MDFSASERSRDIAARVQTFFDAELLPRHREWAHWVRTQPGSPPWFDGLREAVRLGAGLDDDKMLDETSQARAIAADRRGGPRNARRAQPPTAQLARDPSHRRHRPGRGRLRSSIRCQIGVRAASQLWRRYRISGGDQAPVWVAEDRPPSRSGAGVIALALLTSVGTEPTSAATARILRSAA